MLILVMFFLVFFLLFCLSHSFDEFKASDFDFAGRVLWKESHLKLCDIGEDFVPSRHLSG